MDSVTVVVAAGPGVPEVTITSPAEGATFGSTQTVIFEGSATDPEDGSLPDSSFQWISDIDGQLGTGRTLETTLSSEPNPCDTRTHTITLEVTDSDGNSTSRQISVRMRDIC